MLTTEVDKGETTLHIKAFCGVTVLNKEIQC